MNYKREKIRDYLLIYVLLITKAGFFFIETYSGFSSLILLFWLLFYLCKSLVPIQKNQLIITLIILILFSITGLIKGFPEESVLVLFIINLITALLFVSVVQYNEFSKIYSNLIFLICCISIIGQISFNLGIPIVKYFPILTNSKGRSVFFAFLAEFWTTPSSGVYRLQGIFWEPGAFQAMIIIAFLFDIYNNSKIKHKKLRYLSYVFAILLTYSTTGILCLLIFLVLILVKGKKIKLKNIILLSSIIISFLLIIPLLYTHLDGFLYYSIFGKIEMLNDTMEYGASNDATSRYDSIVMPIKYFLQSPILGIGQNGIDKMTTVLGHNMFTCTIVNYFVFYGTLCGIICCRGFLKLIKLRNKSVIEGCLLIILLIVTTATENFAFNPIFTCFILYGYNLRNNFYE